jgi:hypothetical protein
MAWEIWRKKLKKKKILTKTNQINEKDQVKKIRKKRVCISHWREVLIFAGLFQVGLSYCGCNGCSFGEKGLNLEVFFPSGHFFLPGRWFWIVRNSLLQVQFVVIQTMGKVSWITWLMHCRTVLLTMYFAMRVVLGVNNLHR